MRNGQTKATPKKNLTHSNNVTPVMTAKKKREKNSISTARSICSNSIRLTTHRLNTTVQTTGFGTTLQGCVYTYPDRSGYPDVSAPDDRPSVYPKTIEVYALWSNTLRYPEVFENHFKGGSSECPGALRTRVNGASGYPDVFYV